MIGRKNYARNRMSVHRLDQVRKRLLVDIDPPRHIHKQLLLRRKRVFHGFSLYHEGLLLLLQVINISLNERSLLVSFCSQANDKKESHYG